MNFGICLIAVAPLRREPNHQSEMVNQVLFGECMQIIGHQKDWYQVETLEDQYPGWIHKVQLTILTAEGFEKIVKDKRHVSKAAFSVATEERTGQPADQNKKQNLIISGGSSIYAGDDGSMCVAGKKFCFSDELICMEIKNRDAIPEFAKSFLSIPYIWGGRSAYGFDCSGFVQLVFKMAGFLIPRDAAAQANAGEQVHLLQESVPGDLVFFNNEEEIITHVGILLNNKLVIHAYGKVRIDHIDHQGIYNREQKKYSHHLRLIKRIA